MKKKAFIQRSSGALGGLLGLLAASSPQVQGASYQAAVKALKPTYYFQLDETSTTGGVVDSMGKAQPGSYNGNYNGTAGEPSVGFAGAIELFGGTVDGSNGGELLPPIKVPGLGGKANVSHNSNNRGHIILAGPNTDYGANAMTVAFFMKAGPSQGGDRIFTNNIAGDPTKSFQIDCGNNGLVLSVDETKTGLEAERTLYLPGGADRDKRLINPAYGWFHIVASTSGTTGAERASNFQVWVNGVDRTDDLKPDATGWGVETGSAKIGGRGTNPTAAQPLEGGHRSDLRGKNRLPEAKLLLPPRRNRHRQWRGRHHGQCQARFLLQRRLPGGGRTGGRRTRPGDGLRRYRGAWLERPDSQRGPLQ